MACGACKNMKKGCKDNCPFREYFGPQDAPKFKKLKCQYKPELIGEMLSDANTTKEEKERLLQEWYACVNAKGKEKQVGSSSSNNEKKELQASKCQAASKMEVIAEKIELKESSSNELGCKDTCLFADLFSPEAKEIIVKIINQQGMKRVETEVKPKLEKLWREIDEVLVDAEIMLDLKNNGDQK